MKFLLRLLPFVLMLPLLARASAAAPAAPRIDGEPWRIAGSPDLGELGTKHQQPVDFAIWQAADGTWQLWSCIRNTAEPGKTRLFYRWEGRALTDGEWRPEGIAMRADPAVGEIQGGLQAPFVFRDSGRYIMFYGDWKAICRQDGDAGGKNFRRRLNADGKSALFGGEVEANTRDPMLLRTDDGWICYYSANPGGNGAVYARTSANLEHWSAERLVAEGGIRPKNPKFAAECPFVVRLAPGEYFLFETQAYGRDGHSTVRFSRDPLDFRAADNVVCTLPVAAPEIFQFEGRWYIASVCSNLKGIQVARLVWDRGGRDQGLETRD